MDELQGRRTGGTAVSPDLHLSFAELYRRKVARAILTLDEHVAQIDANTERKAVVLRLLRLVFLHGRLPRNGVDEASELDP